MAAGLVLWAATLPAQARVGVTSQTDGDPLGKPPAADERILRVGIDIQADETITTRADDRAHLVFLDGTSMTVGPNARIKVDRFVYDPATRTGDIVMTVSTGVFRLVGGRISKAKAITVNTPSATIGLRGGIGLFSIEPQATTAQFLFGSSMTVTAGARSETALRPGSEISVATGGPPSAPALIRNGAMGNVLRALEARPAAAGADPAPDRQAQQSGFSDRNSGQGTGVLPPGGGQAEAIARKLDSNVLQQTRALQTFPLPTPASPATAAAPLALAPVAMPSIVSGPPQPVATAPPPPPPPPFSPPSIDGHLHLHRYHGYGYGHLQHHRR